MAHLSRCSLFIRAGLDVLVAPRCLACDAHSVPLHRGLCPPCDRRFPPPHVAPCSRCAAPLGPGVRIEACGACQDLRPWFVEAVAGAPYAGFPGELLRRAKYGQDVHLILPLAERLADVACVEAMGAGLDLITPVPGVPRRERERGFHGAGLLAARLSRALNVPVRHDVLVRVGEPPPQASLPRSERRRAAAGTVALAPSPWIVRQSRSWCERAELRLGRRLPLVGVGRQPESLIDGRTILLVDDVLTTGATANACARVLLRAGAREVRVAAALRA